MIFFFENGRLGNQLFQYAALKKLFPNESLVFFGFGDLTKILCLVNAKVFKKEKVPRGLMFGLRKLLYVLADLRLIGVIQEVRISSEYCIKSKRGLLIGLYLLKPSFFQHKSITQSLNSYLKLSNYITLKAQAWLENNKIKNNSDNLVFIQIRRGDYISWPNRDFPAVLDKEWYLRAIDHIKIEVKNPLFIILTDDFYYVKDCFSDQSNLVVSKNDMFVDLAIMSLCSHGILSASSFAWWGAAFSRKNNSTSNMYIAPKYWAGHRKKEQYPPGFTSDWITYIE
jgi:hypothetical protein